MAFDSFEEYADFNQLDILEDLLESGRHSFYIDPEELHGYLKEYWNSSSLTKERADEIIYFLRENKIVTDLDEQFNNKFL